MLFLSSSSSFYFPCFFLMFWQRKSLQQWHQTKTQAERERDREREREREREKRLRRLSYGRAVSRRMPSGLPQTPSGLHRPFLSFSFYFFFSFFSTSTFFLLLLLSSSSTSSPSSSSYERPGLDCGCNNPCSRFSTLITVLTGFYWVLLGFTEYLLGLTWFYRV